VAIFGPQSSGKLSKADADRKRELAKQLMGSNFRAVNPLGALAMGLEGSVSGLYDQDASGAEKAGNAQVAELLAGKDYTGAMGNEWASPQQAALAATLQGRDWQVGDRNAQWAREDARTAQARAEAAAAASRPEFKMFEAGGDQYRYNANDPNSRPELFFDGPNAPGYRPMTAEEKVAAGLPPEMPAQIGPDGKIDPIGGGGQTINVNTDGGSGDFYKKLDTDAGEQQAALIDAGRNASSNNMRLGELQTLLQNAPQGMQGGITQLAGAVGIPVQGLDEVQAAQALINQMVPGQRPPGSGTMSDADLALFKQSLPAIVNQPGGNQKILETAKAINDYTIAQAKIAEQVANREITPAEGRALQSSLPNPLAKPATPAQGGGNWTDVGNGVRIREIN